MTQEAARILLADDHDSFLQTTTEILRRAGYACDGVPDAMAAVAALEQQPYDLFIADIRMPGNENLELLHACTSEKYAVPLMLITASPTMDTAITSLRAEVVDYLIKPVEVPQLLSSVERALANGRVWKTMRQTRQDMQSWAQHLEQLEQSMMRPGTPARTGSTGWSLEHYIEQTTSALLKTVVGLSQTLTMLRQGQSRSPVDICRTLQCPRRSLYEASIDDAITVITNTRNAFKSRELGELRKRLEEVRRTPSSTTL